MGESYVSKISTYKKVFFLVLTLLFSVEFYGQDCSVISDFTPVCIGTTQTYTAETSGGSARDITPGNNYGCLSSTPNSKWFFFQASTGGSLIINQTNSNNVDVDGAIWGPFDSINDMLSQCGSYSTPLDCDYEPESFFTFYIPTVTSGKYYAFLVTNYSGDPTNITLSDGGSTATTNCSQDTDGDNIADVYDLDDDNDGILDIDEQSCTTTNVPGANASSATSSTGVSSPGNAIGSDNQLAWMNSSSEELIVNLGSVIPAGVTITIEAMKYRSSGGNNVQMIVEESYDGVSFTSSTTYTFNNNNTEELKSYTINSDAQYLKIHGVNFGGGRWLGVDNVSYSSFSYTNCADINTDGDAFVDRLDVDSDGDGCPDAIEGDENVEVSQLDGNDRINIFSTGGITNFGVPNLVNSGGAADIGGDEGQGVGSKLVFSADASPNLIITPPPTVCFSNTVDLTANNVTDGTNGSSTTGTLTYWTDAAATNTLATPAAVATSGTYYIKLTSASGCYEIEPVVVTIQDEVTEGTIAGDQVICSGGNPVAFTSDVDGSGSGTISYRWEMSEDGTNWSTISGETSSIYDPTALTVTTQFRRITISTQNGVACESSPTAVVTVIVDTNDADSDGINDVCDLDDDNDGILDSSEGACTTNYFAVFGGDGGSTTSFSQSAVSSAVFDFYYVDNSVAIEINGGGLNTNNVLQLENIVNSGEVIMEFTSDNSLMSSPWLANTNGIPRLKVEIDFSGNITVYGSRSTSSTSLELMQPRDGSSFNTISFLAGINNFNVINQDGSGPDRIGGAVKVYSSCVDTDNDNIPDYLDTDSDGDGCFDAIEGNEDVDISDLSSGRITGGVDSDGVPNIVNSGGSADGGNNTQGQGIGTSATANTDAVPTLIITNPASVCSPSTVDLTASTVTDGANGSSSAGTLTYWTDSAATNTLADPNAIATSGTYYIKLTSVSGCYEIESVVVVVDIAPAAPVSSGDITECETSPIQTLDANDALSSTTGITWYDASTGGNVVASPTLNTVGTATYYAEYNDGTCTSLTRTSVVLTITGAPDAGTNGTLTICEGTTVTETQLFAELGGTPDTGGAWSPALAGAGIYTYTVAATSSCTSEATSEVVVTEEAVPSIPSISVERATCSTPGRAIITNYDSSLTYVFNDSTLAVDENGVINGYNFGVTYTVSVSSSCGRGTSEDFVVNGRLSGEDCVDTDNDGIPDAIDVDDDNDGIPDVEEGDGSVDTDNDGIPDSLDLDSDNDGINDVIEGGNGDLDTNGDGVIDSNDSGYTDANGDGQADDSVDTNEEPDTDGDGIPDYQDLDSDDDGINDVVEGGNSDEDGDGQVDNPSEDSDGDGIADSVDGFDGHGDANSPDNNTDPTGPNSGGNGVVDDSGIDSDGDGIADSVDGLEGFGDAINEDTCVKVNNLMSPNGDSANSYLHIDCIENFPSNTIEIFNRWGNTVYRAKGYNNSSIVFRGLSEGRANINVGDKLPVGTYFYILDLGNGSKVKKGWIYINR